MTIHRILTASVVLLLAAAPGCEKYRIPTTEPEPSPPELSVPAEPPEEGPDSGPVLTEAPLALEVGRCSRQGKERESNEDVLAVDETGAGTLCVVASGVGEPRLGLLAAKESVEVLTRAVKQGGPEARTSRQNRAVIRRALLAAHQDLLAGARRDYELGRSACVVVLAWWHKGPEIYVAGLGDSRAYLVRGDTALRQTTDHTRAQQLLERGHLRPDELATHRYRNILWKYLGAKELGQEIEVRALPVRPGDRLVLCTHAVASAVPDDGIRRCVREHPDAQACAEALTRLALDADARGNASCLVISVADRK